MKIAVLIDIETYYEDDPQLEGKLEELQTELEFHVTETLRELGHEVHVLPVREDIHETMHALTDLGPRLVFNLTEHFAGDRHKDMHIAALLEMMGLPYTGTGPKGLMLCRDKALGKRVLSHHRVRVPDFAVCPLGKSKPARKLRFPLIIKPMLADGSEGITLSSRVKNEEDLVERIRIVHEQMQGPVICEEYIEGREIYVGVLGNTRLLVLPPREVRYGRVDEGGPVFTTSKVKLDEAYRKKWAIEFVNADLPDALIKRIAAVAKRIYRLLHIRDYGRIDMRLKENGDLYFLEANPNPDLTMGDEVSEAAGHIGITYKNLIKRIVQLALRRHRAE